jgi:hypothetical protein
VNEGGLHLSISRDQDLWVVEGGDLMILVAQLEVMFLRKRSKLAR